MSIEDASPRSGPQPGLRALPLLPTALAGALFCFGGGWLVANGFDGEPPAAQASPSTTDAELAMEARVARLEADGKVVARVAAASLALVTLGDASASGGRFVEALAAAESVLPASPDLVALRPLAAVGAPSREGLLQSFPAAAARARAAAPGETRGVSGFSRAFGRILGGAPAPPRDGAGLLIARAEAQARSGSLSGTLAAIEQLPPPVRASLDPWAAAARRRLELEQRLASVRVLALNELAAVSRRTP